MNVELPRAENDDFSEPATWSRFSPTDEDPPVTVVTCQNGHAGTLVTHTIGADGSVTPSLVCSYVGCGWHVFARLLGWPVASNQEVP